MIIFTCAVLFFKGRPASKISFVATGLIGIIFINILRLIFVCLAFIHLTRYFFNLHHSSNLYCDNIWVYLFDDKMVDRITKWKKINYPNDGIA
jgi:exosortase/archaeosortase family protein